MPALSFAEYADHDALGLAGLVARGEVSPVELAETAYQIIERLDPRLNAFVTLERDALERELAAGLPHGPFRGVPMAMKNCVGYVKGVERSFGSRLASGFIADHDSEVIRRYRDAGFMFVGTTNTPELSSSTTTEPVLYGPTHNPWKLGHTVGGSSGGSACVVAAGMVPVAYANDGAGSIRIPSSCCGVFGLKPSRGRVPNGPQETEFWHGWMMHHSITRSVRDSAAILDCSDGIDEGAPYVAPAKQRPFMQELGAPVKGLRVAWSDRAAAGTEVSAECKAAVRHTLKLLESMGCTIEEAAPEYDGAEFFAGITRMMSIMFARELRGVSEYLGRPAEETTVEKANLLLAARGAKVPATELQGLLRSYGWLTREVGRFMSKYDVFVTPTLGMPPPAHGWLSSNVDDPDEFMRRTWEFAAFTPLANASGVPAMTVPLHWTAEGLPVGTMFMARYGDEATLFRLAAQLEEAQPWSKRRPAVSAWNAGR